MPVTSPVAGLYGSTVLPAPPLHHLPSIRIMQGLPKTAETLWFSGVDVEAFALALLSYLNEKSLSLCSSGYCLLTSNNKLSVN